MTGPNYGSMSDQEAADVLGGHPKSDPVDIAFGMNDPMDGFGDNGFDGECDCDPETDDNCDCGD